MNPPNQMETERLILRKPRRDDAPMIFSAYAQDTEVTRYMIWRPHKNVEETRRVIELMIKLWEEGKAYSYVITPKNSDAAIGMIALHPDGYRVSIGYVLSRSDWGRGYITEAAQAVTHWLLKQPDIYRVFATCDIENSASARVMEKIGMQREGILRRYIVHPNMSAEPRDSFVYAIVK